MCCDLRTLARTNAMLAQASEQMRQLIVKLNCEIPWLKDWLKFCLFCLFVCVFFCYSHGIGYIAIDTANGCIFSWIRSGVGSARSYVQGTLRALGKHRSWMLCEDPVSNSFEVFVCIPKIASQGRFVGVISITYYGYILRDAFGFPFRIDIGTNISIRAAQDEESTSSWFGQLLARWLSSVRQALRYDTG